MARRELSSKLAFAFAFAALAASACRHGDPHQTRQATPAASASASRYADSAREAHFQSELARAHMRWKSKPALGDCSAVLHEKADLELCRAANDALRALEQDPDAPVEAVLPALENGALSLARLSKRLRFLALGELSKKRLDGDAGAAFPSPGAAPSSAPSAHGSLRALINRQREHGPPGAFELGEGPISQLRDTNVRLERDSVRELGAYLEYAELPVRRTAFGAVKRLHEQHPDWPLLSQLLHEAALLESDPELKERLTALSARATPARHAGESK